MANRDDLAIIKAARTGAATAQLALGSRYFSGGSGLPQSTGTAFYWLERSARQGLVDAWMMLGQHVPYEVVTTMPRPYEAATWYEKAFDSGVVKAGLVFARLVLDNAKHFGVGAKKKAIDTLRMLAEKDDHDAQWLLAKQIQLAGGAVPADEGSDIIRLPHIAQFEDQWVQKAAEAGIEDAQYSLLEKAWLKSEFAAFVQGAAPVADRLLWKNRKALAQLDKDAVVTAAVQLDHQQTRLLLRLAQLLLNLDSADLARIQRILELAALAGLPEANYELGLLHARINHEGERIFPAQGLANYNKAIPWLIAAAHGGHAASWHALSRIYSKSEYSQRNLDIAKTYLERAAEMGLANAQFEYAKNAWRNRRDDPLNGIRALHWWQKAQEQGHAEARLSLREFSARPDQHTWAMIAFGRLTPRLKNAHPFLSARVELASIFGLTRPETLLIDVRRADHGHCLEVDICRHHARSKRRLILIENREQRSTLNRIVRLFGDVDCSYDGPEGNYRQRRYKLKSLLPDID